MWMWWDAFFWGRLFSFLTGDAFFFFSSLTRDAFFCFFLFWQEMHSFALSFLFLCWQEGQESSTAGPGRCVSRLLFICWVFFNLSSQCCFSSDKHYHQPVKYFLASNFLFIFSSYLNFQRTKGQYSWCASSCGPTWYIVIRPHNATSSN